MLKNRLLLSSVAFGVSFCLSLLVNRDIKTALRTGLITVPATLCGVVVGNRKHRTQHQSTLTALQTQIPQLERRESELKQSLLASAAEKQRTEVNLNVLKPELNQLYIQITEQRSYKQQLSQDLITLGEHKLQLERELHDVRAELKPLQGQLAERQNQKEVLERDLSFLNNLKLQLEEKTHNLQTQLQELEKKKAELNHCLSAIAATRQETEDSVNYWQTELVRLQKQVAEKQNNQEETGQKLINFHKKEVDNQPIEKLSDEWTEFMMQLPEYEFQVLEAVLEPGNSSAKIKKIAENNIIMPEVLIELINERALDTISELILVPGNEGFPPKIPEEYLTNVKKALEIKKIIDAHGKA